MGVGLAARAALAPASVQVQARVQPGVQPRVIERSIACTPGRCCSCCCGCCCCWRAAVFISPAASHHLGFTKCARRNLVRVAMRGAPAKLRPSPTQSRHSLQLGRRSSPKSPLRSEVASRFRPATDPPHPRSGEAAPNCQPVIPVPKQVYKV